MINKGGDGILVKGKGVPWGELSSFGEGDGLSKEKSGMVIPCNSFFFLTKLDFTGNLSVEQQLSMIPNIIFRKSMSLLFGGATYRKQDHKNEKKIKYYAKRKET